MASLRWSPAPTEIVPDSETIDFEPTTPTGQVEEDQDGDDVDHDSDEDAEGTDDAPSSDSDWYEIPSLGSEPELPSVMSIINGYRQRL